MLKNCLKMSLEITVKLRVTSVLEAEALSLCLTSPESTVTFLSVGVEDAPFPSRSFTGQSVCVRTDSNTSSDILFGLASSLAEKNEGFAF